MEKRQAAIKIRVIFIVVILTGCVGAVFTGAVGQATPPVAERTSAQFADWLLACFKLRFRRLPQRLAYSPDLAKSSLTGTPMALAIFTTIITPGFWVPRSMALM